MHIPLSPNARILLEHRYLKRAPDGTIVETPEELFRRVARAVASADQIFGAHSSAIFALEETFFEMMAALDFLPNSPTLMNAGRPLGQLSACFVLPIKDSIRSIFTTLKQAAIIHQSGGGTGFSFSHLRPQNDPIRSTHGKASGPLSFMEVFDCATEAIKQGGMRRGANMGILRFDHPDILKFINAKRTSGRLKNFNLSVAVSDAFLTAVRTGASIPMVNPHTSKVVQQAAAQDIFDALVQAAWETGDPGLLFLDRVNRDNPTPHLGPMESTNPCGEQPLLPYESCNLGSINLAHFVRSGQVDFDRLRQTVHAAVHFLDNVIEINRFPFPQIKKMTRGNRKIGLGVMGFADFLILLGIPYDSEAAVNQAEEIMHFIQREAFRESQELAQVRGPFPNFRGSVYDQKGTGLVRNATRTTIAPTGSISIIAGTSSGIEPIFAPIFERHILEGKALLDIHPIFEKIARKEGFYRADILSKIATQGHLTGISEIPPKIQRLFRTAREIDSEWHVRIQAAFQKHTDNAVSKTINFPHEIPPDAVSKAFLLAHKLGCKGITIYRDRSKSEQVLTVRSKESFFSEKNRKGLNIEEGLRFVKGKIVRQQTGCGKMRCLD